jgi:toxin-antitoxin system PIN domain toxin
MPYLLDVNVLIALAWPHHVHHGTAAAWFGRKKSAGFRTCPLTQAGFVRISSNPQFYAGAVSPMEAIHLLERIIALPDHDFWQDDLMLPTVGNQFQITSHQQVTDAYLVALAASRDGIVATLDRRMLAVTRESSSLVEVLAP